MSDHSHAGPPVPAEPDAIGAAFRAWFDDHMRGLSVSGLEEDDLRQAFTTAWLQGARTQRATDRQMAIERGICQSRCLDHRHLPFADLLESGTP